MVSQTDLHEMDPIESQLNRLLAIESFANRRRSRSSSLRQPCRLSVLPSWSESSGDCESLSSLEYPEEHPSFPAGLSLPPPEDCEPLSSPERPEDPSSLPAGLSPSLPHATPVEITVVASVDAAEEHSADIAVDAEAVAISDGDVLVDMRRLICAVFSGAVLLVGGTFAVSALTLGLAGGAPATPNFPEAVRGESLQPTSAPWALPTVELGFSDTPTSSLFPTSSLTPTSSLSPVDILDTPSQCVLMGTEKIVATYWHVQMGFVKDRTKHSHFGSSVSTAAPGYMVVGAIGGEDGRGAAYTYGLVDGGAAWRLEAKLAADDGAAGDYFGGSVAAWEDLFVVGAYGHLSSAGAAYVYRRDDRRRDHRGRAPEKVQKLVAGDGEHSDYFGFAIGISSASTIVVGAPGDGKGEDIMTGAAYFFEFNSTSNMWKEAQKVVAEDGRANDTFGYSVQIIGDVAAIGARANSGRGFVYIFARLGGGKWVQTHKLSGEGVEELDSFGYSLSMSNDTIVVGDPNQNGKNGVVYIFTRGEAVEWIKTQEITMEGKANYSFGESLAVFGEILVIGAKYEYYGNAADVGATYLFSRNKEGKWLKTNKYVIGHGREGTTFGSSVSAYKNSIIIGAEGDDGTKGSIYVTGLEC